MTEAGSHESPRASLPEAPSLLRALGPFDATMLVMGGIVGSGLFINPYVVAQRVHSPVLILAAWVAGGAVAMAGAFIYAELADRMPNVGGQYAYLRDSFHPLLGFLYGWVLLLVITAGGMAAVTVTFTRYFLALTGRHWPEQWIVIATLALLTIVNCMGAKFGSRVQSVLMVLKIVAIAGVVAAGFLLIRAPHPVLHPVLDRPFGPSLFAAFGSAMVPVLFAYGGWQTSNFIAGEIRDPRRNLARALLAGVLGVIVLYLAMNVVCLRALGPSDLAATTVPATEVMRRAMGNLGATLVALGIAVSTLGFLSQSVLTSPRVYFAMAEDGLFFSQVATVTRRTHVPAVAIVLQTVLAAIVALSGSYEQILNYVVSMDFVFFGLSACCLFVLRRRERRSSRPANPGARVPGHPFTTAAFVLVCWVVVINTVYTYPKNSLLGFAILFMGLPVYAVWNLRNRSRKRNS